MERPSQQQLRLWSETVARDPASLLFLPLAREYQARGLRDAAIRLCHRGLERHPQNVDAHHLLGQLYREAGDATRAFDEWDIALRLDPAHEASRRELDALRATRGDAAAGAGERPENAIAADSELDSRAAAAETPPARPDVADPFAECAGEQGLLGALLTDAQGLVLGGSVDGRDGSTAAAMAASLHGLAADADEATRHLDLGGWTQLVLESDVRTVVLTPLKQGHAAAVLDSELPLGWRLRVSEKVHGSAARWLAMEGAR